jgi:hypothetical protein
VTVRIGVTGHRALRDGEDVAALVDEALDEVSAAGGEPLEVWSSLADGADRLVVHRVLDRAQATLVAVLPLDADDYRRDFTPASAVEFDELLAAAREVIVTGPGSSGSRESAYERAGRAVVDACDVLLALWDGEASRGRGGTAEIVAYARSNGREVRIVEVERA